MAKEKFVYAKGPETILYKSVDSEGKGATKVNYILMGTYMQIEEENNGWCFVKTAGKDGWVNKSDTTDDMGLKIFFIDVGQGDGVLIEVGDKKILVDGGPSKNFHNYLVKWQYSYLVNSSKKINIDSVFISHFDEDHYTGLLPIINNKSFAFDTIYHNGIARFTGADAKKNKRPEEYNEDLGKVIKSEGHEYLVTSFDSINDLKKLYKKGGIQESFTKFADAIFNAKKEGRLKAIKRLTNKDTITGYETFGKVFKMEALGPVVNINDGQVEYTWFKDSSHTRNGHSIVLKITYGNKSFLFGGDLNKMSENHLMNSYADNPFEVDISKSCHHGSSDFDVKFFQRTNPFATVISSGDNENYSHPRADAIGCAGKYARGEKPLVFSTELARSINTAGKILFGMINCRCNGNSIIMAQMKERKGVGSIWDSYIIE